MKQQSEYKNDYESLLSKYSILNNQNQQLMKQADESERKAKKFKKAYYELLKKER